MTDASAFGSAFRDWMDASMHRSMHALMLYARRNGFSMSQLRALVHISKGTRGVQEIGDDLEISTAGASQMLERMVQQGLITREEDPHDRRVRQIVLTDKGRQVVDDGLRAGRAWVDTLAASLSPDEIDLVAAALAIMADRASQLDQPSDP
ncbi:MAG: MarR family winged helix-turn-helix transcriptional regulator [Anaerolineae bacterium]